VLCDLRTSNSATTTTTTTTRIASYSTMYRPYSYIAKNTATLLYNIFTVTDTVSTCHILALVLVYYNTTGDRAYVWSKRWCKVEVCYRHLHDGDEDLCTVPGCDRKDQESSCCSCTGGTQKLLSEHCFLRTLLRALLHFQVYASVKLCIFAVLYRPTVFYIRVYMCSV
jgi:hypothetical protein